MTPPARLPAPLLLALCLAACGTDASGGGETTRATTTGGTSGHATTTDAPAAPTSSAAATSSGDAATTTGTSSETSGADATTTTGTSTTDDLPGTTTTTGADEPLPDPCAHQDDPPPGGDEPGATNDDPAFIQVYANNVENLKLADEQCAGDWTDLIYAMKAFKPAPDVFLVQQLSDTAQLDQLLARMNDELPGSFAGVIADADPWTQGSPCGPEKAKQTNAVVYREGRFSQVGDKHVWQAWASKNDGCVRSQQARTRIVMVKLHDEIADKHVTVASVHWGTSQGSGADPACAEKNIAEVDAKVHKSGFGGDLVVYGGDFNETDRQGDGDFRQWYRTANGDDGGALNYRDPIFRACQSADKLQACLDDEATIGSSKRIDFLFAQDGAGCRARTRRAHTVTFDEADAAAEDFTGSDNGGLHYSDHRSVRAAVYY